MLRSSISFVILLFGLMGFGQDAPDETAKDTIIKNQKYGLRVGIDLGRPIYGLFDDSYQGFEVVADYRLTQRWFAAVEFGNEKNTRQEDLYNYTSSGSYFKLGAEYNLYQNWYGMNNAITIGGRLAGSSFKQTLNEYQIFDSDRYWSPDDFATGTLLTGEEFSGLSATWLEFVLGAKAELFANFFLGASVRLELLLSNKEDDTLPNLWIPGYNRVRDGSRFGVSYNYTLTYFIPFFKKTNQKKKETP